MAEHSREEVMPGMLFHILHRAFLNAAQAELSANGLADLGSPMILFILHRRGTNGEIARQQVLSQELRVSPATIATSLKSLERLGYVEKRSDPHDARCKRIAITEKGLAAMNRCMDIFQQLDRHMLEGLTQQEQLDLERLHRKMLENLEPNWPCEKGGNHPCSEN